MAAYIMLIMVVFFYSGNILVGKAINELPPFTIAFFRLMIAFLCIVPLGWKSAWKAKNIFWAHRLPLIVLTVTGVTFFNTFIYGALQFTSSTNVSVLETIIPAVTVLLSTYILKERLRFIQWIGVVLSIVGALWVVMNGRLFAIAEMNWNAGDGIMVGAIACWSIYSIAVKRYMHLFPPYGVLLVMTGISIIILVPFITAEWLFLGVPSFTLSEQLPSLAYLGLFPGFIALLFYNRAVDQLGASKASVFLNFLPVVTMAGAVLWLEETLTPAKVIGALIVIAGVLLTTQGRPKRFPGGHPSRKP
ncbi:DMT family transporter [Marinococcus sp. PL1-022]|uniref:DMT family transporter n=1 Tax=Marinococcus sp. PL1-022 TaxID=3095363 RepID=UPI0029C43BE7|nr:DMT family transporter [Marinococcus sp. PL1-022]MDX6151424.1 DMT family transporter [Marinococcus sp. PL1-022]